MFELAAVGADDLLGERDAQAVAEGERRGRVADSRDRAAIPCEGRGRRPASARTSPTAVQAVLALAGDGGVDHLYRFGRACGSKSTRKTCTGAAEYCKAAGGFRESSPGRACSSTSPKLTSASCRRGPFESGDGFSRSHARPPALARRRACGETGIELRPVN